MTAVISIDDFRTDGGGVDWEALRKAEVANGEYCRTCNKMIMWHKGVLTECHQCKRADSVEEFRHDKFIRCPSCRVTWVPDGQDDCHLFEEDCHDVTCGDCEQDFEVSTYVSYSFTSPPLEESNDDE